MTIDRADWHWNSAEKLYRETYETIMTNSVLVL